LLIFLQLLLLLLFLQLLLLFLFLPLLLFLLLLLFLQLFLFIQLLLLLLLLLLLFYIFLFFPSCNCLKLTNNITNFQQFIIFQQNIRQDSSNLTLHLTFLPQLINPPLNCFYILPRILQFPKQIINIFTQSQLQTHQTHSPNIHLTPIIIVLITFLTAVLRHSTSSRQFRVIIFH